MWNTSYTNQICFTKEKNYEQDLHLTRLLNIRPRITITEPYIPYFRHSGGWQREKKRQEEDKVEKVNIIYYTKIFEANKKHSRYSRYEVEPKQIYPAFRRFSRYKLSDIHNMIRIREDNIRHENKIAEIKSDYDRVDMRKEAYKQKLYLSNLLKRPKSIPYAPQLKFKSIEQVNNIRLRSQILKNQKYFKTQTSITEGKRRNYSMTQLRNDMNNKSINNDKNKSLNKSKASKKTEGSKHKKSINIESENNYVSNKKEENNNNITTKKNNKKETTTKSNSGMKK